MSDTTYAELEDLLIGDVPTPAYVNPQKFLNDAADEIDSKIGFRYDTPLDVQPTSSLARPARLLIKRLTAHLASGRLLLSVDTSGEETTIHAYGLYLIQECEAALAMIANGQVTLEGATPIEGATSVAGPIYSNIDAESAVEAFYDRVANPLYVFPPQDSYARLRYGSG